MICKYYPTWFGLLDPRKGEGGWAKYEVRDVDKWLSEHTHSTDITHEEFGDGPEHFHLCFESVCEGEGLPT